MSTKGIDHQAVERNAAESGTIAPEDSFLVQIRGGSRLSDRAVVGRIEHLYSGESVQFGSLGELLDFLARHFSGHDSETASAALA